jgi:hypothetical protein
MATQAIMNHEKNFIDVFVGLLGFINDTTIFQITRIYHKAMYEGSFFVQCNNFLKINPNFSMTKLPIVIVTYNAFQRH